MTISQKRAIGYAIRERGSLSMWDFLNDHNLATAFYESGYKSIRWFLKAYLRGIEKEIEQEKAENNGACHASTVELENKCISALRGTYKSIG